MKNSATIDLLLARRSVIAQNLIPPGPDKTDLQTILQAGLRVPDHGVTQPWRIQVISKKGQKALGESFLKIFRRENPDANDALQKLEQERPQRSPALLVVTSHPNPDRYIKVPHIEQLMSAGAVCQNLLIAANALGFSAQWVTGWPAYHVEVRQALGHSPDTEVVGFIHIGTAKEAPKERARPKMEKIVSKWDGTN